MNINKTTLLISIFLTNTILSIDVIVIIEQGLKLATAAEHITKAAKDVKDMTSDAEAEKNAQSRLNMEKREIEKNLRECLEKNIGEELSELNVPKVCAEFVRKFINMYGIDEFSKKVCAYDAMCKADRALSKNQ